MSAKKVKFTVVIPLYNKSRHIIETVNTVLAQQYPADEIIVVDDGSSDGGAELLEAQNIASLVVIRQKNAGVSAARNVGIAAARHNFVALLDADDLWSPLFLAEIARSISEKPGAGLYATSYQMMDGDDHYSDAVVRGLSSSSDIRLMNNYFSVAASGDLPFITSSVCMNRRALGGKFVFPEREPMGEDQDLWSQIALFSTIVYSPRVLVMYVRCADNRACVNAPPKEECPFSMRLYKYAQGPEIDAELRDDILKYCGSHLISIAKLNIYSGDLSRARAILQDARCWRKPFHKVWWSLIRWIYLVRSC